VNVEGLLPLLLILPMAGFLITAFIGRRFGKQAHWIPVGAIFLAWVIAMIAVFNVLTGAAPLLPGSEDTHGYIVGPWEWIPASGFHVDLGIFVDPLTACLLIVVTTIGLLVHVYSIGYMSHDPGYWRFFAYLNLFMFSMLLLVLADSWLVVFVAWELVGLSSYLLIGFWYRKRSAALAAKKAFIVNRVGDVGFGLGIMWIWSAMGTLDYDGVFKGAAELPPATATGIALLLFMGACGKSAQLPLHTWLPDAMEGPTPVSALIHAATMVTAGVYMVARSRALFERSPVALEVVAWVGVATALFAATIGLVQTDIKRVLAYSTVSQLGYMFAAVGLGAYAAGIFHLVTHAFFKALLFLGAGSVIHGLGGEQDLRKMGGLSSRMVTTTITTTIGALGLAGLPGLAGFFSKDEILAAAFVTGHRGMWALLLLGAFFTAFYTARMLFLAFYSGPRMTREAAHHVHESPGVMTLPLAVLAVLTVITGVALGIPSEHGTRFARFLAPVFPVPAGGHGGFAALLVLVMAVLVFAAGVTLAWVEYMAVPIRADAIGRPKTAVHALLLNAYYVDALYDRVIVRPLHALSEFLARVFDLRLIDGLVNALGRSVVAWAAGIRHLQTGYTVNYALTMLAGAVAIVAFLLSR